MPQTHKIFLETHDTDTDFTLKRALTFVTDDTSTMTAISGPGCTLDRAISWGGRHVEELATWIAKAAGVDPGSLILGIARDMTREMASEVECPSCQHSWTPTPPSPPSSPSVDAIYTWPIQLASWKPRCLRCGAIARVDWPMNMSGATKSLQKLVNKMKSSNPVLGVIAINYVAFLSAVLPGTQRVFEDLGARGVLHKISESLENDLRYLDPLLASSRSALVLFEDTKLFELTEQYMQQESRISDPDIPDDHPLMRGQTQLHHDILNYFVDPHMKLVALSVVMKHGSYFVQMKKPDLSCARWTQHPKTNMLALLWREAEYSPDPALSAMAATLLEHGYHIRVPNDVMMDVAVQCWATHRNPHQHLRRLLDRIRERAREVAIQSGLPPSTPDLWQRALLRYCEANPEFKFTGGTSEHGSRTLLNSPSDASEATRTLYNDDTPPSNEDLSSEKSVTGLHDYNVPNSPPGSLHHNINTHAERGRGLDNTRDTQVHMPACWAGKGVVKSCWRRLTRGLRTTGGHGRCADITKDSRCLLF